jgi:hypothetical protein
MDWLTRAALFAAVAGVVTLNATPSFAFCRTRDNPNVSDGMVTSSCYDTADKPVFWRNACVGVSMNRAGSSQVPYATANMILLATFDKWSQATCASGGNPSIKVQDLGPSDCAKQEANQDGANQNLVAFHDSGWPYNACSETLALTTVTYHLDTGELWDVDIEVNTDCGHKITTSQPVPADGWDLQSIFQHETGHFLGLAHSPDSKATMYWTYSQGSDTKRNLDADDMAGICAIYQPNNTRSVDPSVVAGGLLAAGPCDPTPRTRFWAACSAPPTPTGGGSSGCHCGVGPRPAHGAEPLLFGLAGLLLRRARRRVPGRARRC